MARERLWATLPGTGRLHGIAVDASPVSTFRRDTSGGGVRHKRSAAAVTEVELSTGSTVRTPGPAAAIAETVRTGQPGDIMMLDWRDGHGRDQVAFVRVGFVAAVRSIGG